MKDRPFLESFPKYLLSMVSGLGTSGNFMPKKRGFFWNSSTCSVVREPSSFCIK